MLSRTADHIYWTARYVERAEFLARILEATLRLASLPTSYGGHGTEWDSAVLTSGCAAAFYKIHPHADEHNVRDFLAFSPDNPSSIRNCLAIARTNARAVRTALTMEMWDALNGAWLELQNFQNTTMSREDFARFIEWVKTVSLTYDGSAYRTMLRNDSYWFSRVGVAIERADNTARILDVKYHVLLPETEQVGGSLDYFQWTTILREVSAHTAYHWVYRKSVQPWLVADILLLNRQMPRSLAASYDTIVRHLDLISDAYGSRGKSQRAAHALQDKLSAARIEEVFQSGLHEFITSFLTENGKVGAAIADQYLV